MSNSASSPKKRLTNSRAQERLTLIEDLRERGIRNEQVLHALQTVPRESFLDQTFSHRAYEDSALPIGSNQTISQPYTVAYMTEALMLQPREKVLEIGTGSGYQAAILAELRCRVFTIERHLSLMEEARRRFAMLGYDGIISKCGDGTRGWSEYAPYDAIIVTAGAPDVPESLTKQLSPNGGRLIIPIGDRETQAMYRIIRNGEELSGEELPPFSFVPLVGKEGWGDERG